MPHEKWKHENVKVGFNDKQREDRFIRIGLSNKMKILIIVFSEREETLIRIISARRATKNESRIYEERI